MAHLAVEALALSDFLAQLLWFPCLSALTMALNDQRASEDLVLLMCPGTVLCRQLRSPILVILLLCSILLVVLKLVLLFSKTLYFINVHGYI